MTSDHSVLSNDLFKGHLTAKTFNMFLTLQQLREARWFCFNVCCKGDVNMYKCIMVMWIQLQEKPHHQQYHQKHHLIAKVMQNLLV